MDYYSITDEFLIRQFGTNMRRLRVQNNLSQKQLSDASGISVFAIGNLEKGNSCSLNTLVALLRALHALDLLGELFVVERRPTPNEVVRMQEKNNLPERKRVRNKKNTNFKPNLNSTW